jgi:hypothetical protein
MGRNFLLPDESESVLRELGYEQDKETMKWRHPQLPFEVYNKNGTLELWVNAEYDLLENLWIACNRENLEGLTNAFLYLKRKIEVYAV